MDEFFARNPFLRLTLALIMGIVCFSYFGFSIYLLGLSAILSIICFAVFVGAKRLPRLWQRLSESFCGIGIVLAIFSFGYYFPFAKDLENYGISALSGSDVFEVEVAKRPIEKERSVLIYADLICSIDSGVINESEGRVALYFAKDSSLSHIKRGDRLLVKTYLSTTDPAGNPEEFDFGLYQRRRGISGTGYVANGSWKFLGSDSGFSILRLAEECRLRLLQIYIEVGLDGNAFSIVAALTLGYTDSLSQAVRDSFSVTGVAHILSVSGLHVGVIYVFLGLIFSFMDKREKSRRLKYLIIILFLWFYAMLTGLSAAVCRSALMFSIFALGQMIGRHSSIYNSIFLSAFVLLIINPMWLFDVGFQLSYTALLSIIYFQPKISLLIHTKTRLGKYIWELVSVSIAAQIVATPLCLYYFHQFPNYFIPANIVAVPMSSLIIYANVFLFVANRVTFLSQAIGWAVGFMTDFMYESLHFIEQLPYSQLLVWIDLPQLLSIYLFVAGLAMVCYRVSPRGLAVMLVGMIAFLSLHFYQRIQNSAYEEFVVFSSAKSLTISIASKGEISLLSTDTASMSYLTEDYILRYGFDISDTVSLDTTHLFYPFSFDSKNGVALVGNEIYKYSSERPLEVDYLVVGGDLQARSSLFLYYIKPRTLIISSDISVYRKRKFMALAKEYGLETYSVADSGAFRLKSF